MKTSKVLQSCTAVFVVSLFASSARSEPTSFIDSTLPSHALLLPSGHPPAQDLLTCEILSRMTVFLDWAGLSSYPRSMWVRLEAEDTYLCISDGGHGFFMLDAATGRCVGYTID